MPVEEGIMSCVDDNVPTVFISTSPVENNKARSCNYKADEFLIEPGAVVVGATSSA